VCSVFFLSLLLFTHPLLLSSLEPESRGRQLLQPIRSSLHGVLLHSDHHPPTIHPIAKQTPTSNLPITRHMYQRRTLMPSHPSYPGNTEQRSRASYFGTCPLPWLLSARCTDPFVFFHPVIFLLDAHFHCGNSPSSGHMGCEAF
jgi:hypothetical protein